MLRPKQRPDQWRIAQRLLLDHEAARLAERFREGNLPVLLLKGHSFSDLLYPERERTYSDIDLLVPQRLLPDATGLLDAAGFALLADGATRSEHAAHSLEFQRGNVLVDLHLRIPGVTAPADDGWCLLWQDRVRLDVGDGWVWSLGHTARRLHVVLNAAARSAGEPWPVEDVRRLVLATSVEDFDSVNALASALGATGSLGAGLRLVPAGAALADRLRLPSTATPAVWLRSRGEQPLAVRLAEVWERRGPDRRRLLARELVPSKEFMRLHWMLARRGRVGLVTAHLLRYLRLAAGAPAAVAALYRASRSAEVERPDR